LSFDFYDDWDEDDGIGGRGLLGGWGNDELDRLLAGSGSNSGVSEGNQPKGKKGMSYGTNRARRKSLDPDPTIIPSTNTLGFLGRLPFKLGGTLRYKPSAADLQDHPGGSRSDYLSEEGQPLIPEDESDEDNGGGKGHRRQRSSTTSSGATSDSFRSRGDLFPSDGEDDAIPLPDEFAMVLERRGTISNADDKSSGKTKSSKGKRPAGVRSLSRTLSRTGHSSPSVLTLAGMRSNSEASTTPDIQSPGIINVPSMADLEHEEERIRLLEEAEVERKRQAASSLAVERGLQRGERTDGMSESKPPVVENIAEPIHEIETFTSEDDRPPPFPDQQDKKEDEAEESGSNDFIPARLPHFS
jgi:hypothetical protein